MLNANKKKYIETKNKSALSYDQKWNQIKKRKQKYELQVANLRRKKSNHGPSNTNKRSKTENV